MREQLKQVGVNKHPDHLALAYSAWAPIAADGKVPDSERTEWLERVLTCCRVTNDYKHAFKRWKASFRSPTDRIFELQLVSRLLVGHGNASATDVGLTVHHTWGVPVIPGSSLKGLLGNYVDAVFGPDTVELAPWDQPEDQQERARWQGVLWQAARIRRGPGELYRKIFGAPEADEDDEMLRHNIEAGAVAGQVIFHDALFVPGSADNSPYALDVITVHQKRYYDSNGNNNHWPCDYDDPNPVSFLTVRPGTQMLFALSGPTELTEVVEQLLKDALAEWGIGGKTSSGYGRFGPVKAQSSAHATGTARGAQQLAQAGRGTNAGTGRPASAQDKSRDSRLAVLMEASGQQAPKPPRLDKSIPSLRAGQKIKVRVTSTQGSQWTGDYQGITVTFQKPGHGELGADKLVEVQLQSEHGGIWKARFVKYK